MSHLIKEAARVECCKHTDVAYMHWDHVEYKRNGEDGIEKDKIYMCMVIPDMLCLLNTYVL